MIYYRISCLEMYLKLKVDLFIYSKAGVTESANGLLLANSLPKWPQWP